jgi:FG-GAP-like repeat
MCRRRCRRQWLGLVFCAAFLAVGCAPHSLVAPERDAGGGSVEIGDGAAAGDSTAGPTRSPDAAADTSMTAAVDASSDGAPVNPGACVPPSSPSWRLVAPVSGSTVTSARPRLHWARAGGLTEIQICPDRECATPQLVFEGQGVEATPPVDLPPGYWFWRARPEGGDDHSWTRTWLFRVRRRAPGYAPLANTTAEPFSDYNGDGYPDFAINAGTTTYIYLGGPDGIVADQVLHVEGSTIYGGLSVYREPNTDVNGDGFTDFGSKMDIMVPGQSWPTRIALIRFGGSSGLGAGYSAIVEVLTDYYPLWVGEPGGLGDVDGDGYGDMIMTMRYGAAMLRGCAPAPAASPWGFLGCGNCQLQQVATGDFDGDGRSDVIFADATSISVYPGIFAGMSSVRIPGTSGVTVIDFNYDGYSDLLVRRGDPTGTLEPHEGGPSGVSAAISAAPQPPAFLLAGDFDGDGIWDTIAPGCTDCRPPTTSVHYGAPEGWGAPPARTTALDQSVSRAAAVVDLNADGYDDLLVEGPGDGTTSFYAGSPTGLPETPTRTVTR